MFCRIITLAVIITFMTVPFSCILLKAGKSSDLGDEIDDTKECPICFERYNLKERKRIDLCCDLQRPTISHKICKKCLQGVNTCPHCRAPLYIKHENSRTPLAMEHQRNKCSGIFGCFFPQHYPIDD